MDYFEERESLRDFLEKAELQQYYELFRDVLKVTKISQLKFVTSEDLSQIGLSKPEQRHYKKVYAKHFPNSYISKFKKFLSSHKKHEDGNDTIQVDYQPYDDGNCKVPTRHIISIEDIQINKELGMGQFGVVQQGSWNTGHRRLQVAIKCLGNERMASSSAEFLKEAAVMHSIEHPNIVRLYGVVLHMDSLMLVTELAPLRSLLECLREISLRPSFPVSTLCEFAEQICDGMTYLERQRLIHRDLAARNILVFSKNKVKISDFGLSRALGAGKDYYQTDFNVNLKLPVAWCAPECILYLRFTSSSDVWAFAVTLWEMFSYGFQPWAAFSGNQILEAIDAPNHQRLPRPECCSVAYYTTMIECWSHDPELRPNFSDLGQTLRQIRPEKVVTNVAFKRPSDGRRTNFLEYKAGEVIIVLGKEDMTKSAMWYGVTLGGACGIFDPNNIKVNSPVDKSQPHASILPHPTRNSVRTTRPTLLRTDLKRHTYTGKRTIQPNMISSPQGDVKHTSHVGVDGAYFGDISFLESDGSSPSQVVTSYKPAKDSEQVPLISPNSPSHFTGASCSSYPLLTSNTQPIKNGTDTNRTQSGTKPKNPKKQNLKVMEPTTSKSLLNKVKSATIGRAQKADETNADKLEEHEYHEISDTDTESTATENMKTESVTTPESPEITRGYVDFSESLLDEMETIFKNLEVTQEEQTPQAAEANSLGKHFAVEMPFRSHTLNKTEKMWKHLDTGTMKPMSAHDVKTLETAVALADEITTKSLNDLGGDKSQRTPTEKSKFHFKFPLVSLHNSLIHDQDKDGLGKKGKPERRNFSEEARSVPDVQESLTEESKQAYMALIEEPTQALLMSRMKSNEASEMAGISNIHSARKLEKCLHENSWWHVPEQPTLAASKEKYMSLEPVPSSRNEAEASNVLPLPPRTNKPKLVAKPRHIRKYPLKLPTKSDSDTTEITQENTAVAITPDNTAVSRIPDITTVSPTRIPVYVTVTNSSENTAATIPPGVYQNAISIKSQRDIVDRERKSEVHENGVDVFDGTEKVNGTNPFKNKTSTSANPFNRYYNTRNLSEEAGALVEQYDDVTLIKDHVSVEDLLEFANQKPCGRQRGLESDEVRIMKKILKEIATEDCLEALEVCDWDVHHAIKIIKMKLSSPDVTLQECFKSLMKMNEDAKESDTDRLGKDVEK